MKTAFFEDVKSGYEVQRIAHNNKWRLVRVLFNSRGARIMYVDNWSSAPAPSLVQEPPAPTREERNAATGRKGSQ